MLAKPAPDLRWRDVTPEPLYVRRREFLRAVGIGAAAVAGGLGSGDATAQTAGPGKLRPLAGVRPSSFSTDEALTSYRDITTYNNFFEFGTGKDDPVRNAGSLRTEPWTVRIDGAVARGGQFSVDDLIKPHQLEERIYRLRCVEAWSMVVPWIGVPLGDILKRVEPTEKARFVEFTTLHDARQMPGQRQPALEWPYVEGLRLDEAMHPLTLITVGLYGEVLPNQNGAPIRLVVPWKYGFKSIKSIVRIRLVERQPVGSWERMQPREYGFYSNVNPEVHHPRWSQARERRVGEFFRRRTLMFNGYADQVASLYTGMDLKKNY
jgi:methionine sulfoxide reductase catalytic subunit